MASTTEALLQAIVPEVTRGVGMALPALTALTVQGTRIGGQYLKAISVGSIPERLPVLSANEVIRRVRSMGLQVRRQAALQAIAAIRFQADSADYIAALAHGVLPLRDQLPFASHRQRLSYQYTVLVTGHNAFTGELSTQFIRINDTKLRTKNSVIAEASATVLLDEKYGFASVTDATVTLITRQNPNLINA